MFDHLDSGSFILLFVLALVGLGVWLVRCLRIRYIKALQRQAEALTADQKRYDELFNSVAIGLYQTDLSGTLLNVNAACATLLGFDAPEALVGMNLDAFYTDKTRRAAWRRMLEREEALARFEWQLQRPDGQALWISESARIIKDAEGQFLYCQGSLEDITPARQAREEMRQQKEYWEALIVHAPVAVVTLDLQHKIVSTNPAFDALFGFRREQIVGRNLDELIVPPGERERASQLTAEVLAGGVVQLAAWRQRADGRLVEVELAGAPVLLDGKQVGAVGIYQDITRRRQAERELIDRQARLEILNKVTLRVAEMTDLTDIMSTMVEYARWSVTADLAVIAALDQETGRVAEVFSSNYPMDAIPPGTEIVGRGVLGLILQGNVVHTPDVTAEAAYCGYPDWHPQIRACLGVPIKYGERILGMMLLGNVESPREFGAHDREVILTLSNLTAVAMHTAYQFTELKEAIALQRKILETAATAVYTVDTAMTITSVNEAFTEITGYTADEIIGRPCTILNSDQCVHCNLFADLSAGPISRQECEITAKSGKRLSIIKNADLIRNERGQVVEGIESFIDVTELIDARRAAEAASRAKGEFLANMSHELRTPLNAILGFVQLMQRSPNFPAEHRQNLQIISQSSENLLDLINDILDMSRIEAGRMTFEPINFDLHALLESVLALFTLRTQKKGLSLQLECAPDVPQFIRTDERKLRQVLLNLLSNAIKFTEKGGVTLRVETAAASGESELTPASLCRLYFEVEDTGIGIAPEELDELFKAFTQTSSGKRSQEGTGLGLPISRRFVELMGGTLSVRSQLGKGSSFRFSIQVEPVTAEQVTQTPPPRQVIGLAPDQPEYRILIVDDRGENRLLIRELLASAGFAVREAANGREAIAMHAAWHPHLIFMDIRMPVMDGYAATQHIKATPEGANTVIVALTASALEEDRQTSLAMGCDDYLRKPVRAIEVFEMVAQHLPVRYVYADHIAPDNKLETVMATFVLTPQALAALPAAWRAEVRAAALRARGDLVQDLITQIQTEHPAVATSLSQLVDEFQFHQIITLLAQAEGLNP
ncbi:MAG: PAS domain S-box protein [Anaerolineae bacterium]